AQQQRAELGGETAARDALGALSLRAALRLVGLDEMLLIAEVAGLDEVHDAPQIQQPVFERRAGEGELVLALELLHGLRDLRAGVLDELRLVENHRAERELLQLL